jgi:hypothetical protein
MQSARYFCSIVTVSEFSRQIFIKVPNIKLQENQSSGSRADNADRRTDMTKVTCAFHDYANAPKT